MSGHTCPRRAEGGPWAQRPTAEAADGPDDYQPGGGLVGQPRACTYCGSMSPEDFLDAVKAGAEVGPTDKSYKVYVRGMPNPDPDRLHVLTSSSQPREGLKSWGELSKAERKAVKAGGGRDRKNWFYSFRTMATVDGKFYFGHMSEAQGSEFKRLYLDGKVNMGYPGHFYTPVGLPLLPEDR